MKRILIFTADFGYGHRSTSNAIAEALKKLYGQDCEVVINNPLTDKQAPPFLREDQNNYDLIVRELPDLYKLGYQIGETRVAGSFLESTFTLMLFNVLRKIIRQEEPDVIVCTYPLYQGILDAIFVVERHHIPLITIVTDLATVASIWFHPIVDLCLVPTQTVYQLAVDAGLPAEKLKITGIPVRTDLDTEGQDRDSIRQGLGWLPNQFTVLAVGSKRVEHLYDSVRVLNHSGLPIQLAIVAGGDDELYKRLQETEWHVDAHLYNYVTEMGTFMKASDCILSKAGGLTVSEALACGLPLIMIDVIPGQETGNAEFVVSGDAGILAKDPIEVLETMCHWLEKDKGRYTQLAQNAGQLGRPKAAFDVARIIWDIA